MNRKDQFVKILGQNIRRLRREKNLTLEQLALSSELTYSQISRIELGKRNPTAYSLFIISNTLKCHPADFFSGIEKFYE